MVRTPLELARLEEELDFYRIALNATFSKRDKEDILREIRKRERQLGIDSKPYNG